MVLGALKLPRRCTATCYAAQSAFARYFSRALTPFLSRSLNKNVALPKDFPPREKVKQWLVTLNGLRAVDQLDEEQVRQLLFDLEAGYSSFHKSL